MKNAEIIKEITEKYERIHLKNIAKSLKDIDAIYMRVTDETIKKAMVGISKNMSKSSILKIVNRRLDTALEGFSSSIQLNIENSIDQSWELAADKRVEIVKSSFKDVSDDLLQSLSDRRLKALEAFKKRRIAGMNLSDRIWREEKLFREELEDALYRGISEGIPAPKLATQLQQYLKEPNKLFRRVRVYDPSTGGYKLIESAPMKAYNPGAGVYKSSYKNARRVAVTETNISYRSADNEAWKNDPLVKGIRIVLSNNHKTYDVCDSLVGLYPPNYKHVGFHPHCLCFAVPELVTDKEYNAMEDANLFGTPAPKINRVTDIPESAKKWYKDNEKRVAKMKNTPYFIADNKELMKQYLK